MPFSPCSIERFTSDEDHRPLEAVRPAVALQSHRLVPALRSPVLSEADSLKVRLADARGVDRATLEASAVSGIGRMRAPFSGTGREVA